MFTEKNNYKKKLILLNPPTKKTTSSQNKIVTVLKKKTFICGSLPALSLYLFIYLYINTDCGQLLLWPFETNKEKKKPSSILFLSSELVSRMLTVVNEYEVVQSGGWVKPTLRWTWLQWPLGLSPALVIHWKELTINLMVSKPWPQSVEMTWHRVDRRISGFKTESSLTCTLYWYLVNVAVVFIWF